FSGLNRLSIHGIRSVARTTTGISLLRKRSAPSAYETSSLTALDDAAAGEIRTIMAWDFSSALPVSSDQLSPGNSSSSGVHGLRPALLSWAANSCAHNLSLSA